MPVPKNHHGDLLKLQIPELTPDLLKQNCFKKVLEFVFVTRLSPLIIFMIRQFEDILSLRIKSVLLSL